MRSYLFRALRCGGLQGFKRAIELADTVVAGQAHLAARDRTRRVTLNATVPGATEEVTTPSRGADRDRKLATKLQRHSTTCLAKLQTAGAGSVRSRPSRVAVCAPANRSDGHASAGAESAAKLILQLDHSMGAN